MRLPETGSSGGWVRAGWSPLGSVWVYSDLAISRVDTRTNKLTQIIPLRGSKAGGDYNGGYLYGGFATFAGGKVWVMTPAGAYEIDPTTNTATRLPIRIKPFRDIDEPEIAAGAGSVWLRTSENHSRPRRRWVQEIDSHLSRPRAAPDSPTPRIPMPPQTHPSVHRW